MENTRIIYKKELCEMIPHSGSMCLLDTVTHWDDKHITCYSNTHQHTTNPLRNKKSLAVYALIEYGAQAMAIHGGLISKASGNKIQQAYLAALRDVTIKETDISHIYSLLKVEATLHMAAEGNMIYYFTVTSENKQLINGRATVVAIFNN